MSNEIVILESNKSIPYETLYEIIRDVGKRSHQPIGSSSYVAASKEKGTNYLFATKVIQKKKPGVHDPRSIGVLLQLQHQNIARLREVFETNAFLYLVYELIDGDQLFHRLAESKAYTEMTIAGYFRQITEGIRFLHGYGIVHKNLKPENILLSSHAEDAIVKITDAGLHNFMVEDMDAELLCCNATFCAPELLTSRKFDKAFDLWALGILLHIMLCGSDPYYPKTEGDLYRAILNGPLMFDQEGWEQVSWNGRDVVRGLVVVDPNQRTNTVQVLEHPWVTGRHTPDKQLDVTQAQLREYNLRRKEWIMPASKDPVVRLQQKINETLEEAYRKSIIESFSETATTDVEPGISQNSSEIERESLSSPDSEHEAVDIIREVPVVSKRSEPDKRDSPRPTSALKDDNPIM